MARNSQVKAVTPISNDQFASAGYDNTAKVWTRLNPSAHEFRELRRFIGHTGAVYAVTYIQNCEKYPNGALATGSYDHSACLFSFFIGKLVFIEQILQQMIIWNFETAEPIHICKGHIDTVNVVKYWSERDVVVTGSWDNTIKVWKSGVCIQTLVGHTGQIQSLLVMPDGHTIISASNDTKIIIWVDGIAIEYLDIHKQPVRSLSFCNDDTFVSCGNDGKIVHWSEEGELIKAEHISNAVLYSICSVGKIDNKQIVAVGSEDRSVAIFDLEAFTKRAVLIHPKSVTCVSAFSNGDIITACYDGGLRIWSNDPKRKQGNEDLMKQHEEELQLFDLKQIQLDY
ncbi:MAG: putative phospholipase A-2-activating protein [Streblomastix strix]|uniref:Putative phospholipase A-2-activating protein n=1 Tax=Streblomastix strix TaxID=222440 RepID=A0A5J4ULE2_9EUKA|nr:MAG: putative phospholipase A-2-activating protein [Streblomastix strix]